MHDRLSARATAVVAHRAHVAHANSDMGDAMGNRPEMRGTHHHSVTNVSLRKIGEV